MPPPCPSLKAILAANYGASAVSEKQGCASPRGRRSAQLRAGTPRNTPPRCADCITASGAGRHSLRRGSVRSRRGKRARQRRGLCAPVPIPQGAERNVKPFRELFLRQTKRAPNDCHLRLRLHTREPLRRHGLRIGIGECGGMAFGVGHRVESAPIVFGRPRRRLHVFLSANPMVMLPASQSC